MTSEGEPDDILKVGLLKNATGHDRIQARDLCKTASEFRVKANLILCFNEIPGVDDINGGIAHRLALIKFLFNIVDNPSLPNEKKIDNGLHKKSSNKKNTERVS